MTKGRSIRLFLVDGLPGGIITAEIMNWTGHVMAAPRSRLADLIQRPEAGRTGIYILSGSDGGYRPLVYVGETDSVGKRLAQHNKDDAKEFWEQTCIVTSKDQNLTKAHVRYLESRLIQIAAQAGRVRLANSTAPDAPMLPEADLSDMEFFIDQLRVVLPVLGLDLLKDATPRHATETTLPAPPIPGTRSRGPRLARQGALDFGNRLGVPDDVIGYGLPPSLPPADAPDSGHDGDVFELQDRKTGKSAQACEIEGEFIILEGSFARADSPDSPNSYRPLRQSLKEDGTLLAEDTGDGFVFTRDTAFRSPSAASAVVLDRNDNGRTSWRLKGQRGTTYADWQEAQITAITPAEAEE